MPGAKQAAGVICNFSHWILLQPSLAACLALRSHPKENRFRMTSSFRNGPLNRRAQTEVLSARRTEPPPRPTKFRQSAAVARNLRPASLKVLPKLQFLPGFQQFRKVFAELLAQRIGVISLPGSARRAGAIARAAALSDWLFCLGIKAVAAVSAASPHCGTIRSM